MPLKEESTDGAVSNVLQEITPKRREGVWIRSRVVYRTQIADRIHLADERRELVLARELVEATEIGGWIAC